jgi:hypothetical protein
MGAAASLRKMPTITTCTRAPMATSIKRLSAGTGANTTTAVGLPSIRQPLSLKLKPTRKIKNSEMTLLALRTISVHQPAGIAPTRIVRTTVEACATSVVPAQTSSTQTTPGADHPTAGRSASGAMGQLNHDANNRERGKQLEQNRNSGAGSPPKRGGSEATAGVPDHSKPLSLLSNQQFSRCMAKFTRGLPPLLLFLVLASVGLSTPAQTIPPVRAKALDESEMVLPAPGNHQLLLILIGFSHNSGKACAIWGKRLAADYTSDPHTTYYQLAELQSAPSFVRGMILHGMHKDVPPAQHSHFVPLFDHEAEWKTLVQFSSPDDPYIVLAAPEGHVLWQTHGAYSDSAYAALQSVVAKFTAARAKS